MKRVSRVINEGGYAVLYMPGHPLADKKGRVLEHRLVAYEAGLLGPRGDSRHVHHINGIKDDNRLENLEVLTNGEHRRQHQLGVLLRLDIDREEVARRLAEGAPVQRLARELKCSQYLIGSVQRAAGIAPLPPGRPRKSA